MASYRGIEYQIDSRSKYPFTRYKAYTEDCLGIETKWFDSALEAGNELRKLIDESIIDRDSLAKS